MTIWLIGFLFCWGMMVKSVDDREIRLGFWLTTGALFALLICWPMFLGTVAYDFLKEKEDKEDEG